ncbi:ring-hydroxylating dioxygenase, large terminal subunit [Xenococcus sp. PCC 7305]|uniref:Rieske 2Fe-2S domain-containing protein n=1 Tax=Xenococcus sp. PCC 7305 TaxID=102125 RepID=UPI0002ACD1BF|nr:Rieske 2Fe-2S domain-containing protein [Xenococcus sp. PCC 7305]ELS05523.1 ring-hydroxylating dioxygenase, large terminal subunit [Xenococcus sp. PCC 7305]
MSSKDTDFPFANSWFRVATSQELSTTKVIPLHYFDKDFVLFRNAQGHPCILDAHCPHLGAHLGYGGKVQDGIIRCPYHGWLWDEEGHCAGIPYSDKSPQVKIANYPVTEINGLIMMYYHQQGALPTWQIPPIPECNSAEWTPLRLVRRWTTRTDLKNYLDNSIDVAHLHQVHSQTFKAAQSDSVEIEGPVLTHKMSQKYNLSSLSSGGLISEDGNVTTTYYGAGYDVSFYWTQGKFKLGLLQIFTGTPIDGDRLDIQVFFSVKKVLPAPLNQIVAAMMRKDTETTFEQDMPILENKIYKSHPLLLEEDGPIGQCRRWASQFYE